MPESGCVVPHTTTSPLSSAAFTSSTDPKFSKAQPQNCRTSRSLEELVLGGYTVCSMVWESQLSPASFNPPVTVGRALGAGYPDPLKQVKSIAPYRVDILPCGTFTIPQARPGGRGPSSCVRTDRAYGFGFGIRKFEQDEQVLVSSTTHNSLSIRRVDAVSS